MVRLKLAERGERGATTREVSQWFIEFNMKRPKNVSAWLERIGGVYFKQEDGSRGMPRRWFRERRSAPRLPKQ
jgi:hypothetical protein